MSNYGPKKFKLYDDTANIDRKSNRTGDDLECGPNSTVKNYSSKPGQRSAKQQTNDESKKLAQINKKQEVKSYREDVSEEFPEKSWDEISGIIELRLLRKA